MHATWDETIAFHGHVCPGLAHGFRASLAAMQALGAQRAEDEELVAMVENDACGIDAVQVVTGCTIGKGNLVLIDYGKPAYTFYSRRRGKAVRVLVTGDMPADNRLDESRLKARTCQAGEAEQEELQRLQDEALGRYLELPLDQGIVVTEVEMPEPLQARSFPSLTCEACGERVMEPRARVRDGKIVCIPCGTDYAPRWHGVHSK